MDLTTVAKERERGSRGADKLRDKKMKLKWRASSCLPKNSSLVLKLAAVFLLLGFGFRILFRSYTDSLDRIEAPLMIDRRDIPEPAMTVDAAHPAEEESSLQSQDQVTVEEKCDLFTGDWIPNPSGPIYTNESCPLIESPQNCMKNGRPDTGYLYWRWNPRSCELPPFDAGRFLELMRNKTWALIGDSISRNHVQSVLCMLSTVEKPIEMYHDEEYKSRRWHFPSYNLTISVVWSPFLVKAAIFEDMNGVSTSEVKLYLDELDSKWTNMYQNIDYVIISTGKWFLKSSIYYENDTILGCHNCDQSRNLTELRFDFAYEKTLHKVMDFISNSNHKGSIFFRTSTPDHFENGEWHNGGTCPRKAPVKEGEFELKPVNRVLLEIELREFEKARKQAERNGVKLRLLDFTNLSLSRPDGHPGPYRKFQPFARDVNATVQKDCLHWCLPGPIDAWNDVIMEMVVNAD
ncbi:protein trichome birefringence-like 23 [Punica granatum]|uniref:Protein trichome birefringence-like 23 n=1 Tax=Punica granatum TaxID=22663 RepID=A0A6P8DCH4_PUNGR|nr:protein trichome birefringence-like 23 [Punica granatum]